MEIKPHPRSRKKASVTFENPKELIVVGSIVVPPGLSFMKWGIYLGLPTERANESGEGAYLEATLSLKQLGYLAARTEIIPTIGLANQNLDPLEDVRRAMNLAIDNFLDTHS